MKTIYLLRHAQAGSSDTGQDFDRVLTPKGLDDAKALGNFMRGKNYSPDLILCSAAKRTRQTYDQLSKSVVAPDVQFSEEMYSASRGELFAMLQGLDDSVESVMILAHNPAIYELVATIATDGADTHMNRLAQGYEPASLSVVEAGCAQWADIDVDGNTLKDLVSPIDYNAPASPQRWT